MASTLDVEHTYIPPLPYLCLWSLLSQASLLISFCPCFNWLLGIIHCSMSITSSHTRIVITFITHGLFTIEVYRHGSGSKPWSLIMIIILWHRRDRLETTWGSKCRRASRTFSSTTSTSWWDKGTSRFEFIHVFFLEFRIFLFGQNHFVSESSQRFLAATPLQTSSMPTTRYTVSDLLNAYHQVHCL